ncbi:histone-lysine N-methyltransferase SETMAR isoform X2 [Odontomachus brunneus]|uniref:histone-lysine N-methyltransferase SETMAR isoform X2 n=1 Tax=Odontomachus brunneus TaxID=486640 RepID=UPI0013F1A06F|nr:histone-lysine N-methyltransferase SETMAR isoform X2 [Odontomachus brunneus]XP_032685162.1 histone-lysine N-methyltransferase SETMAR isoform X2 [Odontomachus brunneus]
MDSIRQPRRSSTTLPKAAPKEDHGDGLVPSAGLIHYNFLNPGETITTEKYCQQIDEMHRKLQHLCPALVNRKGPILLHDNVRPHVAQPTLQKLNELDYETLPHPPYSPDLSPTDYHFLSTSITSCRRKSSITTVLLKMPSESLSISGHCNSTLPE